MTLAMELQRQKKAGLIEGEKIGVEKGKQQTAIEMLRNGFSIEMVAKCTQFSIEYIMDLGKKNHLL